MEIIEFTNNLMKRLKCSYRVKSDELFIRAMTHSSVSADNYEILELMGDAVIRLVLTYYLIMRYKKKKEGAITELKTKLENETTLSKLADDIGLNKYVIISDHLFKKGYHLESEKLKCDIFESFIGAIFKDSMNQGLNAESICRFILVSLIEQYIDMAEIINTINNYKGKLIELTHKVYKTTPSYLTVYSDDKSLFKSTVFVNEREISVGFGKNKLKAEKEAAKQAFAKINRRIIDNR